MRGLSVRYAVYKRGLAGIPELYMVILVSISRGR